jgi:hypothetical protein
MGEATMNRRTREIEYCEDSAPPAAVCQAFVLALAGALVGIGPEASRRLSGDHAGWGFLIVSALFSASFVIKGAVAHFTQASPFSSKICGFWAGWALLAMSTVSLVAPPLEYRPQLTVQMVLGLLLVVFPLADLMEKRRRQQGA